MAFDSGFGPPINYGWNFGFTTNQSTPVGGGTNPGPVANSSTFDKILALIGIGKDVYLAREQNQLASQAIQSRTVGTIVPSAGGSIPNLGFSSEGGGIPFWLIGVGILVLVLLLFRR
jgi:hypothetical protein